MAHTEIYPDGHLPKSLSQFVGPDSMDGLANKFGKLSSEAFLNGAERVEQRIIHGNEVCPKCKSGLRFDLCCGAGVVK